MQRQCQGQGRGRGRVGERENENEDEDEGEGWNPTIVHVHSVVATGVWLLEREEHRAGT